MVEWLKDAIFYEIYPQSFKDSNGDGIGDFNGIIEKLDYIKELGCNAIWMNPCFDSPFKDAGYDVRDYKKVAMRYGTMEDICRLFEEVHARDMHILLDLVPGHTSEEHSWFVASGKDEKNEYSGRYIWSNDWFEKMGMIPCVAGEAERNGVYAINFFKCQPALNYGFLNPDKPWQKGIDDPDCVATRDAIKDVCLFWLEKGCDGFRVDMADSLVKNDDEKKSGTCRVWNDILVNVKKTYPDAAFVSEWNMPELSINNAGFDMDFYLNWPGNGYNLLLRDYDENGRNDSIFKCDSKRSIKDFFDEYIKAYEAVKNNGLYCLISGNHDTPRAAYKLDDTELKLAYSFLYTLPGASFVYYGDEIGMHYLNLKSKEGGYTRTGSRTPMQWDNSVNCGFSSAEPDKLYLPVDMGKNVPTVENQREQKGSLLNTLKELFALKKKEPAFHKHDNLEIISASSDRRSFAYKRGELLFLCNPSDQHELLDMNTDNKTVLYEIGGMQRNEDSINLLRQSFVILK